MIMGYICFYLFTIGYMGHIWLRDIYIYVLIDIFIWAIYVEILCLLWCIYIYNRYMRYLWVIYGLSDIAPVVYMGLYGLYMVI